MCQARNDKKHDCHAELVSVSHKEFINMMKLQNKHGMLQTESFHL